MLPGLGLQLQILVIDVCNFVIRGISVIICTVKTIKTSDHHTWRDVVGVGRAALGGG